MNDIRNIKNNEYPFVSAVIVAAGNSTRMGRDKIIADLCGIPVIVRTVRAFCRCRSISEIILVTSEDKLAALGEMCEKYHLDKVKKIIKGADERMGSVMRGLNAVSCKCKFAAVHDGARPLASCELIDRVVKLAVKSGAAAPGIPVKDTIKRVRGGIIEATVARESLVAVQTPQVFDIALIKGALTKAGKDEISCTDDCMAVEHMGGSVSICSGEPTNIKLTTPEDFCIARQILADIGGDF